MTFIAADALRRARRRAGLTQQALADRTGMSRLRVSRIETGEVTPRSDTLDALLRACGRRLASLPDRVVDDGALSAIRELLAIEPEYRIDPDFLPVLLHLRPRRNRILLVGDVAARGHGAPVNPISLEIWPEPGPRGAIALRSFRRRCADVPRLASLPDRLAVWYPPGPESFDACIRVATVLRLPTEGRPPPVFVASIDDLIRWTPQRAPLLEAVRAEVAYRRAAPGRQRVYTETAFNDTFLGRRGPR